MPSSIDTPDVIGFDMPAAPAAYQRRRSWLIEFLSTPFKDLDGRASWKQERVQREKNRRGAKPGAPG